MESGSLLEKEEEKTKKEIEEEEEIEEETEKRKTVWTEMEGLDEVEDE